MVAGMIAGALAAAVLATGAGPEGARDSLWLRAEGAFAPPLSFIPSAAKTYNQDLVPAGSRIVVEQRSDRGSTEVTLRVRGVEPGYAYGAHVHQKPCGPYPLDSGGHYQHRPSADPAHVDPGNEVWLNFTATEDGTGHARTRGSWSFRAGEAGSVVLHSDQSGAGERLACFTVPFVPLG
ncbi:Cu-Zn family superoxide dismutase [Streptomyces sp. V4I8]